ncbi:hypothetical protein Pyn_08193 [Prunus yedoensis var. nudiflora]|uniref:Uncharacterized protein n=1 Tax=Prunus yedoensis var. nudiflora TaxID=2094558 RepID=A0A314Y0P1_PRUYE|nr:hypothetical protein Pyn_08193 [Prunus yedoensis var. nudiflora]
MLKNQHLRKRASTSATGRGGERRKKERPRSGRLRNLEEKMSRILKGVKDVQNLSNSLRAQNEIYQENHVELADMVHAQQQSPEPTGTRDTARASSTSTEVEIPRRKVTDARNILKEKKAWRERNEQLVGNLRKGKTQANPEDTEEEDDGITSKLRNLVIGELRSVWDRLGQVEKSKIPRGPEFTEEEIPPTIYSRPTRCSGSGRLEGSKDPLI